MIKETGASPGGGEQEERAARDAEQPVLQQSEPAAAKSTGILKIRASTSTLSCLLWLVGLTGPVVQQARFTGPPWWG